MDAESVRLMIDQDRKEWAKLTAMLDAHPEGALHDRESLEWTSRDVYTHQARLMQSTTTLLATLAGVSVPAADAFDEFQGDDENNVNARIQKRYSHLSLDEARAWAQRVFEERIRTIEAVPGERWDAQLEELAPGDGAQHYRGHASYIVAK